MTKDTLSDAIDVLLDDDPRNAVVVYHAGCADGLSSALVLWYLLGNDAVYIPHRHDSNVSLDRFRNKNVVAVDFAWKRDQTEKIKGMASSLIILDHHVSNLTALNGLPYCYFAPSGHCAARFVLETFRGDLHHTVPFDNLSWLIDYVEDRDLWRWALPDSRAINAALSLWPKNDFSVWDRRLRYDQNVLRDRLCVEGDALVNYQDYMVGILMKGAMPREFCGYRALEVNSGVFWSELGERLGARADLVLIFSQQGNGQYRYEIRTKRADVNAAEIAAKFGGGGHRGAAGFYSSTRV